MARATKTFTADGSGAMDALTTVGVVYNKVTFYEDARRATLDYRIASPLITSPKIIKLAGEKAEIEVPAMNGKTGTYDSDTDVFTLSGSTRFAQEED